MVAGVLGVAFFGAGILELGILVVGMLGAAILGLATVLAGALGAWLLSVGFAAKGIVITLASVVFGAKAGSAASLVCGNSSISSCK